MVWASLINSHYLPLACVWECFIFCSCYWCCMFCGVNVFFTLDNGESAHCSLPQSCSVSNALDRLYFQFCPTVCQCVCEQICWSAILCRFLPIFACRSKMWSVIWPLLVGQTGSWFRILEVTNSSFGSFQALVTAF